MTGRPLGCYSTAWLRASVRRHGNGDPQVPAEPPLPHPARKAAGGLYPLTGFLSSQRLSPPARRHAVVVGAGQARAAAIGRRRGPHPSPFCIEGAPAGTEGRWFSEVLIGHLLGGLAFRLKSLFLLAAARLGAYWPFMRGQSELGLGNVLFLWSVHLLSWPVLHCFGDRCLAILSEVRV